MRSRVFAFLAPGTLLIGAIVLGLVQAVVVTWTATRQPWIGADLRASDAGAVVVVAVVPDGPAQTLPQSAQILRIGAGPGGDGVVLEGADRIEEPGMLGSGERVARFLDRQGALHRILSGPEPVQVDFTTAEGPGSVTLTPEPSRPLRNLPGVFWMQLAVGLAGMWLGAWVAALRSSDRAARMLLLAGYGLGIPAHGAALYSTREIALDPQVFEIASRHNSAGALIFGIGMITLFLMYPRPLVRGA